MMKHQNFWKPDNFWSQDSCKPFKHTKMTVWFCSLWKIFMSVVISEAVQKLWHEMLFPTFFIYIWIQIKYILTVLRQLAIMIQIVAVNTSLIHAILWMNLNKYKFFYRFCKTPNISWSDWKWCDLIWCEI